MKNFKNSFTLMEILIVVGMIAILGAAAIALINPWAQIGKAWDAKRKRDLDTLKKVLEDYYNDKQCYPTTDKICYDSKIDEWKGSLAHPTYISSYCHVCGREQLSPSFKPYLEILPCDPQHSSKKYLYRVQYTTNNCPSWYQLYSDFSINEDLDSIALGCPLGGCGIPAYTGFTSPYGYDYGVSSNNISINPSTKYHCDNGSSCQGCETYEKCKDPVQSPNCYDKPIYGTCQQCCLATGFCNPISCP